MPYNKRSQRSGCYNKSNTEPKHIFRVAGTTYQCTLHPVRCPVKIKVHHKCNRWTAVHPFCKHHAKTILGIELRPVHFASMPHHQFGLFATQTFKKGDLICPYLGAEYQDPDWRCPHSGGDAGENGSAYEIGFHTANGCEVCLDGSCHRSYGSMINHIKESSANATYARVDHLTVAEFRARPQLNLTSERTGVSTTVTTHGGRSVPVRSVPKTLIHGPNLWIQAKKRIDVGKEILVCYGDEGVNRIQTSTSPPLC